MSPATYTVTAPAHPALTPPPGVIPDFQGPYTLKPYTDLTIAGGIIITTCLVGARMFVKARVVRKFLWEDWTCFVGWVSFPRSPPATTDGSCLLSVNLPSLCLT